MNVLFPAVAASFDTDRARSARLFDWAIRVVATLLFPFALTLCVFAPEVLRWWLGADFAAHGALDAHRQCAVGLGRGGLHRGAGALPARPAGPQGR